MGLRGDLARAHPEPCAVGATRDHEALVTPREVHGQAREVVVDAALIDARALSRGGFDAGTDASERRPVQGLSSIRELARAGAR